VFRFDRVHLPRRRAVANAGLVAGSRELFLGQDRGEVNKGARDGRDWDALYPRDLPRTEPPPARLDALHPPLRGRRHLGTRRRLLDEAEVIRGRSIAEGCILATSLYSSNEGGLDAGRRVPDPVDAAVLRDQQPAVAPSADLLRRDSRVEQLAMTYHALGFRRDRRENLLDRPGLWPHMGHKSGRLEDSPRRLPSWREDAP